MRFVSETLRYLQEVSQNGGNLIIRPFRDDSEPNYYLQFAAMNAAVASLKETEKSLDNMMEAWKASLNS